MAQRAFKAAAIVVTLLALAIGLPSCFEKQGGVAVASGGAPAAFDSWRVAEELLKGEPGRALPDFGVETGVKAQEEIARFSESVFDIRAFADVMVDPESGVLGFTTQEDAARALEGICERLRRAGWLCSINDWKTAGVCTREGGDISWLCILCYRIGTGTSVVLQYR